MTFDTALIDRLRPTAEPFDPDWSSETLEAIFAQPASKPLSRRRWLVLVGLPIAATLALAVILVPTFVNNGTPGAPGASAAASQILNKAASDLEAQTLLEGEYLNVKDTAYFWRNGVEQEPRGSVENWVPKHRNLPWIQQTSEDGKVTDTNPQPLDEYNRAYYNEFGDQAKLLESMRTRAVNLNSGQSGDRVSEIWGQAMREFSDPAVPIDFKAAVLRALTTISGVSAIPTTNSIGDLRGTALIYKDVSSAFIFDEETGKYLGMSNGLDNPNAPPIENRSAIVQITKVVNSAPKPDYELDGIYK